MNFKTNLILSVVLFTTLQTSAQNHKPRYFRFATPGCPVDPLTLTTMDGVFRGNNQTVSVTNRVDLKIGVKTVVGPSGSNIEIKDTTKITVSDTFLLKTIMLKSGYAFDIIKQIGSYSIVRLWPPNKSQSFRDASYSVLEYTVDNFNDKAPGKRVSISGVIAAGASNLTIDISKNDYLIPTDILVNNSIEFDRKLYNWNIGVLVMPVKIRPFATESGQFEFLDGVSFGTTLAWTVGHDWQWDKTYNLLIYAGLSSFTADESKIKEQRDDYKITAFSPGLGFMIEKSKIQVSIMSGIDFPSGPVQKKWVYRNMPWFSIGLGFSIYKISEDEGQKSGVNKS